MGAKQVGLKEVAQVAGVSISTVRYSLNGGGTVAAETRQRVCRIAEELGYYPNLVARGLARNRTGQVGVIVPLLSHSWYGRLVETLDTELHESGYQLLLSCTHNQHERQSGAIQSFIGQRMEGIIALPLHYSHPQIFRQAQAAGIPVTLLIRQVPGVDADFVGHDDEEGGYLAATHLLELGRRQLAYVGPIHEVAEVAHSLDRARGVDRAMAEAGLPPALKLVPPRTETTAPIPFGYEAVEAALAGGAVLDAVFASSDEVAQGAVQALKEAGCRIPEEVAVIGYDDLPGSAGLTPSLASIRQPMEEAGRLAVRLLRERIRRGAEQPEPRTLRLKPMVIPRASTTGYDSQPTGAASHGRISP